MMLQRVTDQVTAISYHDTVNDLHGLAFRGKGPFARPEWFALLEEAGHKPLIAVAQDSRGAVALPLARCAQGFEVLTNWYAFTWQPATSGPDANGLLAALAADLAGKAHRITFAKLPDEDGSATLLEEAMRQAGWLVRREVCDANHCLSVNGRSYAEYLAARPGPLRTTLKRKGKKVQIRLSRQFDAADWAAYEAIYAASWKPGEGDPALLRRFAQLESGLGYYLLGLAFADGQPVAVQYWTVENGTAYIHKLAHLPAAEPLSPGTSLTAALMEEVIDRDGVAEVDFGTGNDRYKADWMEAVRPRFRLTCLRPGHPANWPLLAKWAIRGLVSPAAGG